MANKEINIRCFRKFETGGVDKIVNHTVSLGINKPLISIKKDLQTELEIVRTKSAILPTIGSEDTLAHTVHKIQNKTGEYVTLPKIGTVTNPWSKNKINLFYHPEDKFVFVVPDLDEYMDSFSEGSTVHLTGIKIVTGCKETELIVNSTLSDSVVDKVDLDIDLTKFASADVIGGIMNIPGAEFSGTSRPPSMKTDYGVSEIENTDIPTLFFIEISSTGFANKPTPCFLMYPKNIKDFKIKSIRKMDVQEKYYIIL